MTTIPRRGRGYSTVYRQRPRRAAGPVVAWGSIAAGYVIESPAGTTTTSSPVIAMRLAEQVTR